MNIYNEHNFASRREYIEAVALEYGLPCDKVAAIASLLGMEEDFDGLLSACADMAGTTVFQVYG